MSRTIETEPVLKAAAVAIVIGLPLTIIANVVHDNDANSAWLPPLFFGVLLGFALAGFVGGRRASDYPYTNGAVGALAGFLVMALITTLVRVVGDESIGLGRLVGTGLIAYGSGLTGAVAGARNAARR